MTERQAALEQWEAALVDAKAAVDEGDYAAFDEASARFDHWIVEHAKLCA